MAGMVRMARALLGICESTAEISVSRRIDKGLLCRLPIRTREVGAMSRLHKAVVLEPAGNQTGISALRHSVSRRLLMRLMSLVLPAILAHGFSPPSAHATDGFVSCPAGPVKFKDFQLPCAFDDKDISNGSFSGNVIDEGGGHGTTITVDTTPLNPGFTIVATNSPFVSDSTVAEEATLEFDITTQSGLPLIENVSASLINPIATGTGSLTVTISTPGGNLVLTPGTPSGAISFPPVALLHELIHGVLTGGTAGSASLQGLKINFSEIRPSAVCCPPPNPVFGLNASASLRILELDAHTVSVTGGPGGIDGDVDIGSKGKLAVSGSQFISGVVSLAPGATFSNSSSAAPPPVVHNADLSAEINSAINASANLAKLTCDWTLTALTTSQTISSAHTGLNVICVKDVVLNNATITLSGNLGDSFVLNITGKFVNNGGHLVAGGSIQPRDIVYNVLGAGPQVAFTGGGGGVNCCKATGDGTILAVARKIALTPGAVNGSVISGQDIAITGGGRVACSSAFTPASIPNVNCVGGTFCTFSGPAATGCQFFCLAPPICFCPDENCCQQNPCCEPCATAGGPGCEAFNVTTCGCEPEACCFTVGCPVD